MADPERSRSSFIGKGSQISGKVGFAEQATIRGAAEGEITGDNIEIAPSAVVMARITANKLKISGQVDGEIVARERIELLPPDASSMISRMYSALVRRHTPACLTRLTTITLAMLGTAAVMALISAGHAVARDTVGYSMGFKTFGFGGGREDVYEADETYWGLSAYGWRRSATKALASSSILSVRFRWG